MDIPIFTIELQTNLEAGGLSCQSSVNTFSGTSPFTFAWSNGLAGQSASNLTSGGFSVTVTDSTGCMTIQTGSCPPVSTDDIEGLELFSVRPNPANTYLLVQIRLTNREQVQIKLFNSLGQRLFESNHNSNDIEENIDLLDFPAGYYFLQVSTQSGSKTEVISVIR